MGACLSNSLHTHDLSSVSSTNPSQWSEQQILSWLKHTSNLSPLIKPFKKHKISGLAFTSLSQEDMKKELRITEFGLIKEFILLRDEAVREYHRNKLDTFSTTNTHSNPKSYTEEEEEEESGSTQKMYRSLFHQIESNTNTQSNTRDAIQKQLKAIDDERETSPLLTDMVAHAPHNEYNDDEFMENEDEYNRVVMAAEYTHEDEECANRVNHGRVLAAYAHGWKMQNDIKYNLKWTKIRAQERRDSLDVLGINDSSRRDIYDYYFMEQYADVSYNGGCKLVIDGCIHALCLLVYDEYEYMEYCSATIHEISALTFAYLYEEEKSVYQFAFDIWKILYKMNRRHLVDGEEMKSFIGDSLVIEMRRQYWNKYRFEDICLYCNDLLKYRYIELIARREGTTAALAANSYMNDNKYLYRLLKSKKRAFKKYHNFVHHRLDRDSWCRGTQVEIYSTSLQGWQLGEIVKIGGANHSDTIVVSYGGGSDSKYLLKTVKRNDVELVRSTRDYIANRNQWNVGREIEIFSNSDEYWYKARIEAIVARDTESHVIDAFRVQYLKESVYFTKVVDQWSSDCRDIQTITNETLKRYKEAKQCKVWMEDTQSWNRYYVKDIIPNHQYVVVQNEKYETEATERIIDINSGFIRPIH